MTLADAYNPQTWGTYAQWAAAIASFSVAALSLWFSQAGSRRDAKQEKGRHARSLLLVVDEVYPTNENPFAKVELQNLGTSPLLDVKVEIVSQDPSTGEPVPDSWYFARVGPGQTHEIKIDTFSMFMSSFNLHCKDINEVRWTKPQGGKWSRVKKPRRQWKMPFRRRG